MKAAILSIGTELTEGQIINRNAAWISQKLKIFGVQTSSHLVVPDNRDLILKSLEFCSENSDVLFITGGLGPTSDDFTRNVISEWTGRSLEFHEASWQHVKDRLKSRGYTVKDVQRQQCYFPTGSYILSNPEGTANAFEMDFQSKKIFVLPGPPREIEAIWNGSLQAWLSEATKELDPSITLLWETLGVGESDIAIIVEDILKNIDVDRGYRVHLPYVEVKLMFPESKRKSLKNTIEKLDEALAAWTFSKTDTDTALLLAERLKPEQSLVVADLVTGSFLMNRLASAFRSYFSKAHRWQIGNQNSNIPADIQLKLIPLDELTCEAQIVTKNSLQKEQITAPYKTANMHERRLQYFTERALIFWINHI